MHRVVSDYTGGDTRNNMVKVFVRARPPDEAADSSFLHVGEEKRKITIKDPDENSKKYSEVNFQFDSVFWTDSSQKEMFEETCRPLVDHVIEGYNCCCFAYGQTGSGKTYTMFGQEGEIRGAIPRSVEYLFDVLGKRAATNDIAMVCSFLEIYNDAIRDLGKSYLVAMGAENSNGTALHTKTSDLFASLSGKRGNSFFAPAFKKQQQLMTAQAFAGMPALQQAADEYQTMNNEIREDTDGNVFVKDLSLVPVTTMDEVMSLIASGLRLRATHETKMNAVSSRSHTVFTVTVVQRDKVSEQAISGMLNLVDLAGSERLKKSESVGIRLKEALHINTSLTALGKVVMALDPNTESTHVPYRDSKLTRVLQNSLGGNSHTTLIATMLPVPFHYEECLSTLQFANRCRNVTNNPRVNYVGDSEDKDRKIKRLQEELQQLRQKVNLMENSNHGGGMGGGGAGRGAGAQLSPQKLVSILQKLGIKAGIGADGGLVLDGKPVSASVMDIVGGEDDDTVAGSRCGSARGPGEVRFNNPASKVTSDKSRRIIAELEANLKEAHADLDDMRREQDQHVKTIASLTNELTKTQTRAQHKEHTLHAVIAEKEVTMAEQEKRARAEREKEVKTVIRHNADILAQQNEVLQSYPEAVRKYTTLLKQNKDHTAVMEANLRSAFETHLRQLEKSRLAELANTKQQYEYWIKERDSNLGKFVDGFNRFRTKKTEQLRACEKEIITIYEYTMKLEEILHDCEQGKYPIQARQGGSSQRTTTGLLLNTGGTPNTTGVFPKSEREKSYPYGGVSIPRAVKSPNPLTAALHGAVAASSTRGSTSRPGTADRRGSTGHLELSKRIITKHLERQNKTKISAAGTDNAINLMLASGVEGSIGDMGVMDSEMRAHVMKMLTMSANGNEVIPVSSQLGASRGVVRPTSGKKLMVNTQATTIKAGSAGGSALTPQRPDMGQTMPSGSYTTVPFSQLAMITDGDDAGYRREEYADEIAVLKAEVDNLRKARDQEQIQLETVLEDLQSNETFKYLNFLEQERERMQKQIADLSHQLQYSKVVNTSLGRSAKV